MKSYTYSALSVAVLASNVAAFPAKAMEALVAGGIKNNAKRAISTTAPQGTGFLPATPPPFDAATQYVSNTGDYAFVAPTSSDVRGECPGLNAMANHGYLPHSGVATIAEFVSATETVFGMDTDLGTFLALYGAIVDGDLTGWSIDGGPHIGIGGSHNNYEADSSPFMADLNQYGSNTELVIEQFKELYDLQPDADTANYNLAVLAEFRGTRFQESIAKNPYYSYLPFSGIAVSQAAFTFKYRFMANKSEEYPEGILNKEVLKSFSSVTGTDDDLVWTAGYERIPDNWYKRNPADYYSIPYFQADLLEFAALQPEILEVGCNQGTVDSYDVIDVETISGGAYTASQVAANPLCFAMEFALAELPGVTGLSTTDLEPLTTLFGTLTAGLDCTAIGSVNTTALTACPGFSLYGGPTGTVAPGAIQD